MRREMLVTIVEPPPELQKPAAKPGSDPKPGSGGGNDAGVR